MIKLIPLFLALALGVCAGSIAQDTPGPTEKVVKYSPYPEQDFPNQVFFGDTHLHTSYSTDAGMVGNRLGPDEAYRFARGELVKSSHGLPVKLRRPLDFIVISDHAENLGLAPAIAKSDTNLLQSPWGKQIHDFVKAGQFTKGFDMWIEAVNSRKDPLATSPLAKSYWQSATAAAEKFNEPGRFTAFIGFEWTAMPGGNNLHRNVIFRDGKEKADTIIPISAYDADDPEQLWQWMGDYERKTGGRLLAIPHNGNLSNGLMFDDVTLTSKRPLDRPYAEARRRWEPIYEVTQMKGTGEVHPLMASTDEFADFEIWDSATLGAASPGPKTWPREYAREALKRGLAYEAKLGVNPFKFGLIGSTDAHTSLPTTDEDSFFGKVSLVEPTADPIRFDEVVAGRANADKSRQIRAARTAASGLAAVWARENTREALWDAMSRKEVYATTGTRLQVRVFGGFDFTDKDLDQSDFAARGYERGVPMGGDLKSAAAGKSPVLLIRAIRDPDGANLDRVQVVKGWLDSTGTTHEQVYDVAWSGDRKRGADGKVAPVGNTVDVAEATYDNSIGTPALQAYWKDPRFDSNQRAFYYVRVLEIPTPRWTTYDAKVFGVKMPDDVPPSIQERAYTTPIWYTP
jgi:hypothetical protein